MDDTYQVYVNRMVRLSQLDTYRQQVSHLQPSPKYKPTTTGGWGAAPFPGCTVLTPPWQDGDPINADFYTAVQNVQAELVRAFPPGLWQPVPPASFHMTIADLLWADAYEQANQPEDFTTQLTQAIAPIFQRHQAELQTAPLTWQSLGLLLMPRAIALGLVPTQAATYDRICALRRSLYQSKALMALGIEQQYHFTAHITLGYFTDLTAVETAGEDGMAQLINQLDGQNQTWLDHQANAHFVLPAIQFRTFPNMERYDRKVHWPELTCTPQD